MQCPTSHCETILERSQAHLRVKQASFGGSTLPCGLDQTFYPAVIQAAGQHRALVGRRLGPRKRATPEVGTPRRSQERHAMFNSLGHPILHGGALFWSICSIGLSLASFSSPQGFTFWFPASTLHGLLSRTSLSHRSDPVRPPELRGRVVPKSNWSGV